MSKDYLRDYLKLRKFVSQITLANTILFFIFWIIAYFHYNEYSYYLNGNGYNKYVWYFLSSSHTLLPDILSLSISIFFLWKIKEFKLPHISYFAMYNLYYIIMSIFVFFINIYAYQSAFLTASRLVLSFTEFPLYYLFVKYLYQDITRERFSLKNPLLCLMLGCWCLSELLFHIDWINIFMDNERFPLSDFNMARHTTSILFNALTVIFNTTLLKKYLQRRVAVVPSPASSTLSPSNLENSSTSASDEKNEE